MATDFKKNSEKIKTFAIEAPFVEDRFKLLKPDDATEIVFNAALDSFKRKTDYSKYRTQKDEIAEARRLQGQVAGRDTRERQITQPIKAEKTVGRNDPCPCGSGKKYKNCCGRG